jgi:hypothetical protein
MRTETAICARALIWVRIKQGKRTVEATEYLPVLGFSPEQIECPPLVVSWLDRKSISKGE